MTKPNYNLDDNLEKRSDKIKLDDSDKNENTKRQISILEILKYSSTVDYVYIIVGILGAIVAGSGWPGLNILFGTIVNVFVKFEVDYQQAVESGKPTDQVVADFMHTIYVISGSMAGVTVVFIAANYVTIHCFQMFALRQMGIIKQKYFKSILKQEIAWYDQQSSGEFASRISSDFKKFESGINENLGLLVFNLSTSFISLVVGLFYGWKLSLVIISTCPIIIIVSFIITKLQSRYMQKELKSYSIATSVAEEAISAIRTVFAFGGQSKERQRYEQTLKPAMLSGCKRNFVTALGNSINWCTLYASFALGIWYGVRMIVSETDNYDIGDLVVVFWTITCTGFYIGYAAPFLESFQIARTAALGIYQIIDRCSAIDSSSKEGAKLDSNYRIDIELKNVHFSYPTRPDVSILNGLDLKINNGEIVALVGSSGCGKSTIIQLIQRFYDPDVGEVLLDGTNLKELNIGWLREQIGVVGQEPVLFDASIEENIRLGAELSNLVNKEDITHSAEEANAHEFIRQLQEGYQTYVGDRGAQLSGGQKQRIAISRALISKPKILLLDEATSALDLQSETVVQAALDRASKGRTTIIVAHRLSTIINANRIIFLDKGKVLEMGTHQELMKKKCAYYNLVLAQQVDDTNDKPREVAKLAELERKESHSFSLVQRQTSSIGSMRASMRMEGSTLNDNEDAISVSQEELSQSQFPYSRVFSLIWSESGLYFFIALLSALGYGLVTPIYALIFGSFVDEFTVPGIEDDPELLQSETLKYSFFYAGLALGIFVVNTTQITLFGLVGERLTMSLRMMAFSAILKQEVAWFDEPINSAGALCSRLANDAANIQGATGLRIAMMCQALSTLVCSLLVGFLYNWRMALGGLALMPIVATSAVVSSKLYSGQAKQDGQTAQISSKIMIEVMNAVRTVVSLHKQEHFYDKFASALSEHYLAIKGKIFAKAIVLSISLGIPFFAYSIAFLFGGFLLSSRLLTSGDFFRIIESMVFGAVVVGQTAILSSDFTKAKIAAISIFHLIDRSPSGIASDSEELVQIEKTSSDRSQGNVSFRGLYFNYPSRPGQNILNGLSFSANKGETVALVGSSGCGKSTSIQLLEQFYESSKGKIYLDGENIAQLNTDWVRSQMALVSQEPILFSYSIKDNIAYGDNARTVPHDEIVRAAQMANVHDFVHQLPLGYDTPVGSKGTQLSGGQKQRIAIARALIRDPPILLLDEATSALDTTSEKVVQDALNEASKGRTCLVIAHRLKTIVNAHKIVVIHKGQNVEEGTHEELLASKGFYWKLYNSAVTN